MTVTRHRTPDKPKVKYTQGQAAKQLGVTREHLNRVLRGHRQSRSLRIRYRQLLNHSC